MKTKLSQYDSVKRHLKQGKTITPLQALNMYGCFRLGAIIHVLRKEGMCISTKICDNTRYAEYKLRKPYIERGDEYTDTWGKHLQVIDIDIEYDIIDVSVDYKEHEPYILSAFIKQIEWKLIQLQ